MTTTPRKESWNSRLGVILAVAGSAVGLGNFLRFPGLAAQYGSGSFMIAYFISLVLLGIPICWTEWAMGRYAGQRGFNSSPGIFYALVRHPLGKYIGVLGVVIPVMIYMYYVYIEAWCAGYAFYFITGKLNLGNDVNAYRDFWAGFVGASENGLAVGENNQVVWFLIGVFILNFIIIFRGISRGIELFCKFAMPALIVLAIIILVRVLTLGTPDPAKPDQSLVNGLGNMWNPEKIMLQERGSEIPGRPGQYRWNNVVELVGANALQAKETEIAAMPEYRIYRLTVWEQLRNPQLWLAAAGQIFFSLSVGFGVIITYASYLTNKDDVVLSGLTASSANEFCEVALGGMITVPAAFVFLGAAGIAGQGTFGLGFNVLPLVFSQMPFPQLFGGIFFFLLFLAAITSSLSMLQPGIAFLEEGLGLNRKQSVTLLGLLTAIGCLFVVYHSKNVKALDTIDFWVGTLLIFVLATILIIIFGWVVGIEKGWEEAHRGAALRIPSSFKIIIKYVSPLYLLTIFGLFVLFNVFGWDPATHELRPTDYILDLIGSPEHPFDPVARLSVAFILIVVTFFLLLIHAAGKRWSRNGSENSTPHL